MTLADRVWPHRGGHGGFPSRDRFGNGHRAATHSLETTVMKKDARRREPTPGLMEAPHASEDVDHGREGDPKQGKRSPVKRELNIPAATHEPFMWNST